MSWTLNPALSFCSIDDRDIFLDVEGDRYFCLAEPLQSAFRALVGGTVPNDAILDQLHAAKLLVPDDTGVRLRPCPAAIAPVSLLDSPAPADVMRHYPGLIAASLLTKRLLRRQGMVAALTRLARTRASGMHQAAAPDAPADAIAHAFERLALFSTTHDQCLVLSLALAHYLARQGLAAEIVFAVRLRPFKAHCWVECRSSIVNDRLERVQHYTPIRRA